MRNFYLLSSIFLSTLINNLSTSTLFAFDAWDNDNNPVLFENKIKKDFDYTFYENQYTQGQSNVTPWSGWFFPWSQGGFIKPWSQNTNWFPNLVEQKKSSLHWNSENFFLTDSTPLYQPFTLQQLQQMSLDGSIHQLSALEKFDIIVGSKNFNNTRKEYLMMAAKKIESQSLGVKPHDWETAGYCGAWAVASIHFAEPQEMLYTVPEGNPFAGLTLKLYPSDIKQMEMFLFARRDVAEPQHQVMLGRSCGYLDQTSDARLLSSKECLDTNPGALHVILQNMIGIRKQSFVADMSTLAQTWNYPVWAYSFKYLRDSYGNPLRMTSQQKQDYRIKPAMETIAVKTTFYYMDPAIAGYRQAQKYNSNRSGSTFKELYYFLEYDPFTRKITGGTWFNGKALPQLDFSHIENVPDFLWTTEPLSLEGKSEIFKAIFKPLAP